LTSATPPGQGRGSVKQALALTIKWNIIDKVSQQVLYAVTGIVLARILDQAAFGLVGAIMVFQAFAQLLVDSGFSSALIQRKNPDDTDYSTVFWFNMAMSAMLYIVLWFCAPAISSLFKGGELLTSLSRMMFLTFILRAAAIVQANRLIKNMNVRPVAISNSVGLVVGAVVGITLAIAGAGAWAIVWQTIATTLTSGALLWWRGGWRPSMVFSWRSLRECFSVGVGVMGSSFLNTVFQNIYAFFIGHRVGLVSLGYFTQADKWSKMGISSLSQVLTSSFLPVLSRYQDDKAKFAAVSARMNRLTAYLLFPAMGFLAVMARPIFHCLFGEKWDPAIIMFQILLLRGVFTVLSSLYSNYILALGRSKLLVFTELLRDTVALAGILLTLPSIALEAENGIYVGVQLLLWGQVVASALTWLIILGITARLAGATVLSFVRDLLPYAILTLPAMVVMVWLSHFAVSPWLTVVMQVFSGLGLYVGVNMLLGSRVQRDAMNYIMHRTI